MQQCEREITANAVPLERIFLVHICTVIEILKKLFQVII